MPVTIANIAKEAGVSPSTVSKALNSREGVSLPLRNKITRIARRLGYAPYMKARATGMYDAVTKLVGIIYANAGEHLIRDIQSGVDEVLQKAGFYEIRYSVNIGNELYSEERKKHFIEKVLQDKSIVGLLSVFLRIPDSYIASLQKGGIPVVSVNNRTGCGKCVVINNEQASFEATDVLVRLGRKRIGLIMPEETHEPVWAERLAGYRRALDTAGVAYDPYLLVYEHNFTVRDAALATRTLIEHEPHVNGIIYGSDLQAYGGMQALKELGRKIPDDVAVIGFDDMTLSEIIDPPLSSVKQPMLEMGRRGAQLLVEAIRNRDVSHRVVELKGSVVLRQSTHREIPRARLLS